MRFSKSITFSGQFVPNFTALPGHAAPAASFSHADTMKILIVDDEKKLADVLAERLRLRGFEATPVYDGASALARLQELPFDAVVLDLRLPDLDGIEVLRRARAQKSATRFVILSGHASHRDFEICRKLGAAACFYKPPKIDALTAALVGICGENDEFSGARSN